MTKTLLVGLDAACWEYLEPLLQNKEMPTLQKLMDGGAYGKLHSTMPPWTPTAWASIVTGKNPGKHGIYDMLWRRPGSYDFSPTTARSRSGSPFWKRLNDCGYRVGLVNVPFTYPPEPLDGFVVCGFGAPGSAAAIAYPEDAQSWVLENYPDFKPTVEAKFLHSAPPEDILREEIEHQARQVEIALTLSANYEVDVLVINLMLTDHANHKMPDMEQVLEAYRQSDLHLAQLIESFQPDNVMLISDHGSSRLKGDFLLNAWLRERGYLVQIESEADDQRKALNWILMQWLQVHRGWGGIPEKLARALLRRSLPMWPDRLRERFWENISAVIPFAREHVYLNGKPDYAASKVFPGSVYSGLLYLNIVGRDPSGVVPKAQRQLLASRLAGELRAIREPDTGNPLFTNVYTASDIYSGSAAEYAPDIILDSYDKCWNIRTSKHIPVPEQARDRYFVDVANRSDYGWHSRVGIFVFGGVDFSDGHSYHEGVLMDIPATLLNLYHVPIPDDYDGRVLREVMAAGGTGELVLEFQPGDQILATADGDDLTQEENEELASHLRALGYLD